MLLALAITAISSAACGSSTDVATTSPEVTDQTDQPGPTADAPDTSPAPSPLEQIRAWAAPAPFTIDLQPPEARFAGVEPIEVTEDLRALGTVHEPSPQAD